MRQLGLGHFTFLDQSPIDLVRLARAAGFDFVGLRFHPVAPGQLHWLPDATGLKTLSRAMQDEGIGLYDIETVVIDAQLDPETLIPATDARPPPERARAIYTRTTALLDEVSP